MKKLILITLLSGILMVPRSFSQTNPRMENPNYAQTIFFDDFDSAQLNRSVWNISSHGIKEGSKHRKLSIWVDSVATVNQTSGNLNLSMLYYPNYTTTDWDGNPITANFIAGEVSTYEYYSYGVFECNATFANQPGSFPAFWLISAEDCNAIHNNEIDIVELKYDHANPTLDNNTFQYGIPCGAGADGHGFTQNPFFWGGVHTFKCIWSPSKIEFWVDNTFLHQIFNTGQDWYPQYNQRVILSQQIIDYNNNSPEYGISTPQTSNFHWVRVKKFFLAPEITCPSIICSTGTATMDVDLLATNITWQLTPSYLFTVSSGNGSTANIVRASGANGAGKITYSFQMPSGETFTAEKDIWVGPPVIRNVSGPRYNQVGASAIYSATVDGINVTSSYNWSLIPGIFNNYFNPGGLNCYVTWYRAGEYVLVVNSQNICPGTSPSYYYPISVAGGRYLSISPNPTTGETTLELVSNSKESLKEDIEWSLEIYDSMQGIKEKKTKIKDKQTKVNSTNWKDGVYFVRAIIGDEIINEKLVVKH